MTDHLLRAMRRIKAARQLDGDADRDAVTDILDDAQDDIDQYLKTNTRGPKR